MRLISLPASCLAVGTVTVWAIPQPTISQPVPPAAVEWVNRYYEEYYPPEDSKGHGWRLRYIVNAQGELTVVVDIPEPLRFDQEKAERITANALCPEPDEPVWALLDGHSLNVVAQHLNGHFHYEAVCPPPEPES